MVSSQVAAPAPPGLPARKAPRNGCHIILTPFEELPLAGMMPTPRVPIATKPPALSTRTRSPGGLPERSRRRMSDWAEAGAAGGRSAAKRASAAMADR